MGDGISADARHPHLSLSPFPTPDARGRAKELQHGKVDLAVAVVGCGVEDGRLQLAPLPPHKPDITTPEIAVHEARRRRVAGQQAVHGGEQLVRAAQRAAAASSGRGKQRPQPPLAEKGRPAVLRGVVLHRAAQRRGHGEAKALVWAVHAVQRGQRAAQCLSRGLGGDG